MTRWSPPHHLAPYTTPSDTNYRALRDEILHLRKSATQILMLGLTGIPLLVGAAESQNLHLVVIAAPLVVVVFMLLLLGEQHSLMRVGDYIRLHLEPSLNRDKVVGIAWEAYLEETGDRRRYAEGCFAWAFYGLYALYYLAGTYLACETAAAISGDLARLLVGGAYLAIFALSAWFLWKHFPTRGRNGDGPVC